MLKNFLVFLFFILIFSSCKKSETPNPYGNSGQDTLSNPDSIPPPDPKSFAGLHYYIFKPTCANSGCHDGTFEPDFRTIESSYNTLVYQPLIKNNAQGSYKFRVVPYNEAGSVLMNRLTIDIDGQSGIMPLIVDSANDWSVKKAEYIQNIREWIQNGAKDIFGNVPLPGNKQPYLKGVMVTSANGTIPFPREGNSPIDVPEGLGTVDVWFSIGDDSTAATALGYNKIKFTGNPYNYTNSPEVSLQIATPISGTGFDGTQVQFTHKSSFNLSPLPTDTVVFFRGYFKDPMQADTTEIPQSGSLSYILYYCSFKLKQ